MDVRELLAEKREDILCIVARHGAFNVRLFGSVARGEALCALAQQRPAARRPGRARRPHRLAHQWRVVQATRQNSVCITVRPVDRKRTDVLG